CGWNRSLIEPIEVLNIAFACLAIVVLFRLNRRVVPDPVVAAFSALLVVFCLDFWTGILRTTPYSPAFLMVLCCGSLLVSGPAGGTERRYSLAGLCAGLAAGLHASAMALVIVAGVAAQRESPTVRTCVTRIAAFAAAMSATLAVCYAVFFASHPEVYA